MSSTQTKGTETKSPTKKPTSGPAGLGKSHKSYQTVLPCGNKLLQRKWDQTYYDEHRRMVRSAKPMVDTRTPPTRTHVNSKLKKKQLERERTDEIDRDNMTLLKKMQDIMKPAGQPQHKQTYKHHSLNERQRQEEMDRISKENRQMLGRLEQVEPIYKVSDWIEDWRKKEELTERITAFPEAATTTSHTKNVKKTKSDPSTPATEVKVTEEETKVENEDSPKEADTSADN